MAQKLTEELQEDLQFLGKLPSEQSEECLQVAKQFLIQAPEVAITQAIVQLAKKFSVERILLENSIRAVSFFILESCKSDLNQNEYALVYDLALANAIQQIYFDVKPQVRAMLTKTQHDATLPKYQNLSWRLDIELDKKSLRQAKPNATYLLHLQLQDQSQRLLSAQYHDLVHITSQLEVALKEVNSLHVRRVRNYIK